MFPGKLRTRRAKGVRVNVSGIYRVAALGVALAGVVFLVGCGAEEPVPYELEVSFSPENPVPGYATRVSVQVTDLQGNNVEGATEVTFAADGGEPHTLIESAEAGQYVLEGWVIALGGDIAWRADVLADKGRANLTGELTATCAGTGITGAVCCLDSDCQPGFVCGYGSCQVVPGPADTGCYDDAECASGVCAQCTPTAGGCPEGFACAIQESTGAPVCMTDGVDASQAVTLGGVCAAGPSCEDYRVNGTETDLDCGGDTCAACADGMACVAHTDCEAGYCWQGVCGMPTTALGGAGGGTWKTLTTGRDLKT
ncbi:MAG: hypothetical protein VX938_10905, partial [Myxococcota bacterium]|nr:hypothetical protein [Myxococcota bacterium]